MRKNKFYHRALAAGIIVEDAPKNNTKVDNNDVPNYSDSVVADEVVKSFVGFPSEDKVSEENLANFDEVPSEGDYFKEHYVSEDNFPDIDDDDDFFGAVLENLSYSASNMDKITNGRVGYNPEDKNENKLTLDDLFDEDGYINMTGEEFYVDKDGVRHRYKGKMINIFNDDNPEHGEIQVKDFSSSQLKEMFSGDYDMSNVLDVKRVNGKVLYTPIDIKERLSLAYKNLGDKFTTTFVKECSDAYETVKEIYAHSQSAIDNRICDLIGDWERYQSDPEFKKIMDAKWQEIFEKEGDAICSKYVRAYVSYHPEHYPDISAAVKGNVSERKSRIRMMERQCNLIEDEIRSVPSNCNTIARYIKALRMVYNICCKKFMYSPEFNYENLFDARLLDIAREGNPNGYENPKQLYRALMSREICYEGLHIPKYSGRALMDGSVIFREEKRAIEALNDAKEKMKKREFPTKKDKKKIKKLKKAVKKAHKKGLEGINRGNSEILLQSYKYADLDVGELMSISNEDIDMLVFDDSIDIDEWVENKQREEQSYVEATSPEYAEMYADHKYDTISPEEWDKAISIHVATDEENDMIMKMIDKYIIKPIIKSEDPKAMGQFAMFKRALRKKQEEIKKHDPSLKFADNMLSRNEFDYEYAGKKKKLAAKRALSGAIYQQATSEYWRYIIVGHIPCFFYEKDGCTPRRKEDIIEHIAENILINQGILPPRDEMEYVDVLANTGVGRIQESLIRNKALPCDNRKSGKDNKKKSDIEDDSKYSNSTIRKKHLKKSSSDDTSSENIERRNASELTLGDVSSIYDVSSNVLRNTSNPSYSVDVSDNEEAYASMTKDYKALADIASGKASKDAKKKKKKASKKKDKTKKSKKQKKSEKILKREFEEHVLDGLGLDSFDELNERFNS